MLVMARSTHSNSDVIPVLARLGQAIRALAKDHLDKGYEALLEADIIGWLFHLLVIQPGTNAHELHLGARVAGVDGFVDAALGPLDNNAGTRPSVRPELAVEVKVFPRIGFTAQQHRVHLEHVLNDDLPKLGRIRLPSCTCAEVLVDGAGYLNGTYHGMNRLEVVTQRRSAACPSVHLFVVQLSGGRWEVVHRPPTP